MAWHGLSCEVCKFKSHRRCVFTAVKKPCKWTVRENIVNDGLNLEGDVSVWVCVCVWGCECVGVGVGGVM